VDVSCYVEGGLRSEERVGGGDLEGFGDGRWRKGRNEFWADRTFRGGGGWRC
jgi:hypothetical protein